MKLSNLKSEHDLREVPPGMHYDGAAVADFAPTEDEPDLDIWPLSTDRGAEAFSGEPDELIPIFNSIPEPHVRWLTAEQFAYEFGYPPDNVESTVRPTALAEIKRQQRLTLTDQRLEAFERLARLWNGETVGPDRVHLLADKVPSWTDIVSDLDQTHFEDLFPTVHEQDAALVDAFGEFDWFESERTERGWLKSNYVVGVRADYDIEERARTLINGREDLPSLVGDPHEGLPHRFGVGLEAVRARYLEYRSDARTYTDIGGYTVDILETDSNGNRWVGEVLTNHNNTELYRRTYSKLVDLGFPAILVFDNRRTLRRVLNHWERSDLDVSVPGAPFGAAPRLDWLQKKVREAAADPQRDWPVEELYTLTSLWTEVFESGRAPSRSQVVTLNW